VQRATELLELLQSLRYQAWQSVVILDESWFYWEVDWERQCLPKDDEPAARTKRGINHNKTMLMIVWNPNGFCLIDAMPKGEKYSA
jgi:hypothetical protein